jgi:hypothetical protein
MLGGFRATPFARLILCICLKGFSQETDHLSLLDVLSIFHNFSDKIWSLQLPAQRAFRASEKV